VKPSKLLLVSLPICIFGIFLASSAHAAKAFKPDVTRIMPVIGQEYDLLLIRSGKGKALWDRSRTLAEGLPALDGLDPMQEQQAIVGWAAVLSMVERAVVTNEGAVPEAWAQELVRLYHTFIKAEQSFHLFEALARVFALQAGDMAKPMIGLADQFDALTKYSRQGLRWVAGRRLSKKPGPKLRLALLRGLVDLDRRESDWQGMRRSARTLLDGDAKDKAAAAALAEANYELGKVKEGDKALASAAGATDAELDRARFRKELVSARAKGAAGRGQVATLMVNLGEYERLLSTFSKKAALKTANPALDQAYMEALMSSGYDYKAAWAYATRAKGKPPTAGFLGRRIGAGLSLVLEGLFSKSAKARIDEKLMVRLQDDLNAFRKTDAQLADLSLLYLEFIRAIAGENIYKVAERLSPKAKAFGARYPGDIRSVRFLYLIGQLVPDGPDAWGAVSLYRQARRGKSVDKGFYPLMAGAAVRKAIDTGRAHEVAIARTALEEASKKNADPELKLWIAHLLATEVMLQKDQAQVATRLQAVVDAYAAVISTYQPGGATSLQVMCDAASSVATLMFQAGALDDARGLMQQVIPVCGADVNAVTVALVLDLAAGQAGKSGNEMAENLEQMAAHLASRQAQMQAWLWLGSLAEANKDKSLKDKSFSKAAELVMDESSRGKTMLLAPDRRSVLALAGQFNMGAGHMVGSPFGLSVEVDVSARMLLFPPAAVDKAKLSPYLKKADKKKEPLK